MEVQVRLFGAFRNLGPQEVKVSLETPTVTTAEMKTLLASHFRSLPKSSFDAAALVEKSALANESAVLEDHALVSAGSKLALLPPVSGG